MRLRALLNLLMLRISYSSIFPCTLTEVRFVVLPENNQTHNLAIHIH